MKKFFILLSMVLFVGGLYSAGKVDKVTGEYREADTTDTSTFVTKTVPVYPGNMATLSADGTIADGGTFAASLAESKAISTDVSTGTDDSKFTTVKSLVDSANIANGFTRLEADGKLPALDGSQLLNLPASGTTPTTIINQLTQALAMNSFNANTGATMAYIATIDGLADGNVVKVINTVDPLTGGMDFNYTKLTLHLNNNVTDSSSLNATVTNTDVTFTNSAGEYKFGYAAVFNGTSAKLTAPHIAGFNLGASTNPWTIECWYKPTAGGSGDRNILAHYKTAASYDGWVLYHSSAGKVGFGCYNPSLSAVSTTTLSDGTWYHIAIVNNGTTTKMYINGTEEDSETSINIAPWTTELSIGDNAQGGWLKGTIDEVKIDNGIARYTANFTPPASEFYASWLTVNPADDERIEPLTNADGDSVVLSAKGDYLDLRYELSTKKWWVVGKQGTPVDNN